MPKNGPDRRFMAMTAYLGGRFNIAGEKWYGSNRDNVEKGISAIHFNGHAEQCGYGGSRGADVGEPHQCSADGARYAGSRSEISGRPESRSMRTDRRRCYQPYLFHVSD